LAEDVAESVTQFYTYTTRDHYLSLHSDKQQH